MDGVFLPQKEPQVDLDIEAIREPGEKGFLALIWLFSGFVISTFVSTALTNPAMAAMITALAAVCGVASWISLKMVYAWILGDGIEVSPHQYPQIYSVVKDASEKMKINIPRVIILQGHGLLEMIVARRFMRRGMIIITSNLLDEFAERPTSREFMFFIGRQLGHIKAGHFNYWFVKDVIGRFSLFIYYAWRRRCNLTADKIGMLVAGDARAAVQALCIITVGGKIAPSTNLEEVSQQSERHADSFWSWLHQIFSTYPYMIDRIVRLQRYAVTVIDEKRPGIGAIEMKHIPLRSIPILIIHGRDHVSLLELKDFLYSKFPFVVPEVMMMTTAAAMTLPEKFESVSRDAVGAIALMTPDDVGGLLADKSPQAPSEVLARARQNVVVEIGWAWGKLGRHRCLLLARGEIEIPSDFSGVELHKFTSSPKECGEVVREFVEQLLCSLPH